jgi:hypothetical protein
MTGEAPLGGRESQESSWEDHNRTYGRLKSETGLIPPQFEILPSGRGAARAGAGKTRWNLARRQGKSFAADPARGRGERRPRSGARVPRRLDFSRRSARTPARWRDNNNSLRSRKGAG